MTSPSQWKKAHSKMYRKVTDYIEYHDVSSGDAAGMARIFGTNPTSAGTVVTEITAMRTAVVFACVRLIAGALASTPMPVYKREGGIGSIATQIDHPLYWLFNEEPTPRFSAASFWEYVGAQILLRGDSINYIARKNPYSNDVLGIIPVARQNVEIQRVNDRLLYRICEYDDMGTQRYFICDQDDVLHFPGFGFNGLSSYSVIGWAARQAIGVALAADNFAGQFFGSGAHMQYAIESPKEMTKKQQDEFREAWVEHYCGTGFTGKPLVLTEGLKVSELSMNAVDAQLLSTRQWQVIDICRAFGVQPFMVGETDKASSWGTGIESMTRSFVQYTMQPYFTRISQECNRKLFPARYQTFMAFDPRAALRGDTAALTEWFQASLGGTQSPGWMTQNEVRRFENLGPIEGGDKLYAPQPAQKPSAPSPGGNQT